MDHFLEDVPDDDPFFEELDDYVYCNEDYCGEVDDKDLEPPPGHVVCQDYTLNSPLIADEVDGYIQYLRGDHSGLVFDRGNWEQRSLWFQDERVSEWDLNGSTSYHRWTVDVMKLQIPGEDFQDLFDETDRDAEESFCIVKGFVKSWIGEDIYYKTRTDLDDRTARYGALYLLWHYITLLLNCATDKEAAALESLTGAKGVKREGKNWVFNLVKPGLGKVIVGYGLVYVEHGFQILDRNMTLMLKDMLGGRFQTLMHCQYKEHTNYPTGYLEKINSLFDAGDTVIEHYGSGGYNIIKLLEPIMSNSMHNSASAARPLLPGLNSFGYHLEQEKAGLINNYPLAAGFFDLLDSFTRLPEMLTAYGSFRLWGHPFIDYFRGLEQLYLNTHLEKDIDLEYAESLASDLAYKVLRKKFLSEKKWYVNKLLLPLTHPLRTYIVDNGWPSAGVIEEFGDNWHRLPLTKCFDIPDMIDPSVIYADRSYSPNRDDLISHITSGVNGPLPSKSVLESLLSKPATVWGSFLQRINDFGLELNKLIIGLNAKEREIKDIGRFFALMSWELREYFVVTEYLIKLHFVPLFGGLTMADDFNTVTNKMLRASQGQAESGYKLVSIANHIDYSKWNNHQRGEANNPVFTVMGQFLGYPNLINRTHEFFQKSLVYYRARTDLMAVDNGRVVNRTNKRVCWEGQAGGLEGLRQKGWSVVNYLCIERQAKVRSTSIRALAQGDNQVLTTRYKIKPARTEQELKSNIDDAFSNNKKIMESIRSGTSKLGLIINENETLQSAGVLIYGKNIIYRGAFQVLAEKRLARVLCTTNDQLPTIASIFGSVVTNCLSIAHFSNDPLNAIVQYNWLGNFARVVLEKHDPAIKGPVANYQKGWSGQDRLSYRLYSLYLDPSLGGVGGLSLTRFLIRQFPDPVTEGLVFWKSIAELNLSADMTTIACAAGNPRIATYSPDHFIKLLENPTGLNLPKGLSSISVLRDRIRAGLVQNSDRIANHVIQSAVHRVAVDREKLVNYLQTVKPCFPRFLSEFYSSTFMGLVEGILGLFENSKTIRRTLKHQLGSDFDEIVVRSEVTSIVGLKGRTQDHLLHPLWKCSSKQADLLRLESWGTEIIGATVPHPLEMLSHQGILHGDCLKCRSGDYRSDYVAAIIPLAPLYPAISRGPYNPYLGSKTSETTSFIQPWEKSTNLPLMKRCMNIRDAICWFVAPGSKLAAVILDNIKKLSGEEADVFTEGYSRTGSALHRFKCARQSNGGFSGVSPNLASWFILTTDTLELLGDKNYDFLYQSLLIHSQVSAITDQCFLPKGGTYHYHLNCLECIREIVEPTLDSEMDFEFKDMSEEMASWKPDGVQWFQRKALLKIKSGSWEKVPNHLKSFHLGRLVGFCYGDSSGGGGVETTDLFPNVIGYHVNPRLFLRGIADGVYRACALSLTHKLSATKGRLHQESLVGSYHVIVRRMSRETAFIAMTRGERWEKELTLVPHRISPRYPAAVEDDGQVLEAYLFRLLQHYYTRAVKYTPPSSTIWVFADYLSMSVAGPLILSEPVTQIYFKGTLTSADRTELRKIANTDGLIRSDANSEGFVSELLPNVRVLSTGHELRSAAKEIAPDPLLEEEDTVGADFGPLHVYPVTECEISMIPEKQHASRINVPDIRSPVMSGLRLAQLATGSFYKFHSIFKALKLTVRDFVCGGDGSGGGTASILRYSIHSRGIFNSLMMGDNLSFRGTTPGPPPAISQMPGWISRRCVNLKTCWEDPSDLSRNETWQNFIKLKEQHDLNISLILLDMELTSSETEEAILTHLKAHGLGLLNSQGHVIYKTYLGALFNQDSNVLTALGSCFDRVRLFQTNISGSHTSEVYVVLSQMRSKYMQKRYPDWKRLYGQLSMFHCFRSVRGEFIRALQGFNRDSLAGIPDMYIPDLDLEFSQVFSWLGLDRSVSVVLAETLRNSPEKDIPELVMAVILYVSHQLFPFDVPKPANKLIPSDPGLGKYLSFLCGAYYWMSLISRNFGLYNKLHIMNQTNIIFSYHLGPQTREGLYYFKWSMIKDYGRSKSIRLDSLQAAEARIIRLLTRKCTVYTPQLNWVMVRSRLKCLPHSREFEVIREYSGVMDIFQSEPMLAISQRELGYEESVPMEEEGELGGDW